MRARRTLPAVLLLWSLTAAAVIAAEGAVATRPALDLNDPAAVTALLKSLGAERYAQRQSGQSVLDAVPITQFEQLKRLTGEATDPEIKARLQRRLDAMQNRLDFNPMPISLDVKGATLGDLATALGKATGLGFSAGPSAPKAQVTLNVEQKDYWETMQELWKQQPFWFQDDTTQLAVSRPMPHVLVREGACVMLTDFVKGPTSTGKAGAQAGFVVAVDPRMKLLLAQGPGGKLDASPAITRAVYANGSAFDTKIESVTGKFQQLRGVTVARGSIVNATFNFTTTDAPASISVRGNMNLAVIVSEESVELRNAGENLPQPMELERFDVTLRTLTVNKTNDPANPQSLTISLEDRRKWGPGVVPARGAIADQGRPPVAGVLMAYLYDRNGKLVWTGETDSNYSQAGIGARNVPGTYEGPFKLVVSAPTLRVWNIPFEFKDVPVK